MLRSSVLTKLAKWLLNAHEACMEHAPASIYRELHQALICGASLHSVELSETLATSGVVHLVVSQGLHLALVLALVDALTPRLYARIYLRALLTTTLVVVVGFQAMVVRAAIALAMRSIDRRQRLNWSPIHCAVGSTAACLALETSFWSSRSLPLACAGAIGASARGGRLKRCALAFCAVSPLLLSSQHGINPLSIIVVWCLAPAFTVLHFPLSLASFAVSQAAVPADFVWNLTLGLVREITTLLPNTAMRTTALVSEHSKDVLFWPWAYVAALALTTHILRFHRARKSRA